MVFVPQTHSLSDIARAYYANSLTPKTSHPTNLHNLFRLYKINPQDVEKIEPVSSIPERLNTFETDIAETRNDSIIQEFLDDADVSIYTDGSKIDAEGVGTSAVMFKKGHILPSSKLRYHLGHKSQHFSNEAEAVGLLLGHKARDGTDLTLIKISWISAHSDVQENEMADGEAKLAAMGKTSMTDMLPHFLRQPLPKNTSAMKQEFHKCLKDRWKTRWKNSPRHDKFSRIDDQFPMSNFNKAKDNLTRKQASLIV